MNSQTDISEIIIEEFDTDALPTLDDLMQEFQAADDSAFDDAASVGGIRVVAEKTSEIAPPVLEARVVEKQAPPKNDSALLRGSEELLASLKRTQTDFDNYRRRIERERGEHYAFALTTIVKELLPVLDNFHLALSNAGQHDSKTDLSEFFKGFELILRQLEKVLSTLGIERIQAVGETFNPHFHEAVAVEAALDAPANTIIEELARGYRLGDKLIRPSMVKVSQ